MTKRLLLGAILTLALNLSPHPAPAAPPETTRHCLEQATAPGWMTSSLEAQLKGVFAQDSKPSGPAASKAARSRRHGAPRLRPLPLKKRAARQPGSQRPLAQASAPATRPDKRIGQKPLAERLLAHARQYLHTPYRRGASLRHGRATDCSGFVQHVYQDFDIDLPRSSAEQSQEGKLAARKMDFAKLEPGDLLFFRRGRRIGHVGIYLGQGQMIHAADRRHGVIITDLHQSRITHSFAKAKRVLDTPPQP